MRQGTSFLYFVQSLPYLHSGMRELRVHSSVPEWYALFQACLVVTPLAVHEEDSEVDHIEVRDRSVEAGRERPGERHQ